MNNKISGLMEKLETQISALQSKYGTDPAYAEELADLTEHLERAKKEVKISQFRKQEFSRLNHLVKSGQWDGHEPETIN